MGTASSKAAARVGEGEGVLVIVAVAVAVAVKVTVEVAVRVAVAVALGMGVSLGTAVAVGNGAAGLHADNNPSRIARAARVHPLRSVLCIFIGENLAPERGPAQGIRQQLIISL
jgi:hypothetical protein